MPINDDIDKKKKTYAKAQAEIMGNGRENPGILKRLDNAIQKRNQYIADQKKRLSDLEKLDPENLDEKGIASLKKNVQQLQNNIPIQEDKAKANNRITEIRKEYHTSRNIELQLDQAALEYIKGRKSKLNNPEKNEEIRKRLYENYKYTKTTRIRMRKSRASEKYKAAQCATEIEKIDRRIEKLNFDPKKNRNKLKNLKKEKVDLQKRSEKYTTRATDSNQDYEMAGKLLKTAIDTKKMSKVKKQFEKLNKSIISRNKIRDTLEESNENTLKYQRQLDAAKDEDKPNAERRVEKYNRIAGDAKSDHELANALIKKHSDKADFKGIKKEFENLNDGILERNKLRAVFHNEQRWALELAAKAEKKTDPFKKADLDRRAKKHQARIEDAKNFYEYAKTLLKDASATNYSGLKKQLQNLNDGITERNKFRTLLESEYKIEMKRLRQAAQEQDPDKKADYELSAEIHKQKSRDADNNRKLGNELLKKAMAGDHTELKNIKKRFEQLNHGVNERNKLREVFEKEQKAVLKLNAKAAKIPSPEKRVEKEQAKLEAKIHSDRIPESEKDYEFANKLLKDATSKNTLGGLKTSLDQYNAAVNSRNKPRDEHEKEQKIALESKIKYEKLESENNPNNKNKIEQLKLSETQHRNRSEDARSDRELANTLLANTQNSENPGPLLRNLKTQFAQLNNSIKTRKTIRTLKEKSQKKKLNRDQELEITNLKLSENAVTKAIKEDTDPYSVKLKNHDKNQELNDKKEQLERKSNKHLTRIQEAKKYQDEADKLIKAAVDKPDKFKKLRSDLANLKQKMQAEKVKRIDQEKATKYKLDTFQTLRGNVEKIKALAIKRSHKDHRNYFYQAKTTDAKTDYAFAGRLLAKVEDAKNAPTTNDPTKDRENFKKAVKAFNKEFKGFKNRSKARDNFRKDVEKEFKLIKKYGNKLSDLRKDLAKNPNSLSAKHKVEQMERKIAKHESKAVKNRKIYENAQKLSDTPAESMQSESPAPSEPSLVKPQPTPPAPSASPVAPSVQPTSTPIAAVTTKHASTTQQTNSASLPNTAATAPTSPTPLPQHTSMRAVVSAKAIKFDQVLSKTLEELKKIRSSNLDIYSNCTIDYKYQSATSAKPETRSIQIKEGGVVKCTLDLIDKDGDKDNKIMRATFPKEPEPKIYRLALSLMALNSPDKDIPREFTITPGEKDKPKSILGLYEAARADGFHAAKVENASEYFPDTPASGSPSHADYVAIQQLEQKELEQHRTAFIREELKEAKPIEVPKRSQSFS